MVLARGQQWTRPTGHHFRWRYHRAHHGRDVIRWMKIPYTSMPLYFLLQNNYMYDNCLLLNQIIHNIFIYQALIIINIQLNKIKNQIIIMSAAKKLFLVFTEIGRLPPKLYKRQLCALKIIQKDQSYKVRQFDNQLSASNAMLIYQMQHQKFLLDEKKMEIEKKIGSLNRMNDNVQKQGLKGGDVKKECLESKQTQLISNVDHTLKNEKKQPKNNAKNKLAEMQAFKQSLYKLTPPMQKILVNYTPTLAQIPVNPEKTYTGFFDGCSKFNPGPSGAGYYITDYEQKVLEACWPLGSKTNNQAEFTALLYLLIDAYGNGIRNINIFGDSKLVIDISRGKMRASHQNIVEYSQAVSKVLKFFDYKKLQFIERKYNSKADKLSNDALKKKFDAEKEKAINITK